MKGVRKTRQARQRLLNKLYDAGYEDETLIKEMEVHEFMKMPNIALADIHTFLELQMAIKRNKVISFLGGMKLEMSCKGKKKMVHDDEQLLVHTQ